MKQSAGILLYKLVQQKLQVLLVHPGGPFFQKKDLGSWTVPKGEFDSTEHAIDAARREFFEETGQEVKGNEIPLKNITQKGGKTVYCFAVEGEFDVRKLKSNTFEMEWPPRSGKKKEFPEVDRAEWFAAEQAMEKIIEAQKAFIVELHTLLNLNR
ncbi:NUDIX hydrolase [Sphingobacteriaceae bacterium]|nr:NUDIX hydrolase [Sphingobacteriaceae bacterium]